MIKLIEHVLLVLFIVSVMYSCAGSIVAVAAVLR